MGIAEETSDISQSGYLVCGLKFESGHAEY
jgi:hypothetical protein